MKRLLILPLLPLFVEANETNTLLLQKIEALEKSLQTLKKEAQLNKEIQQENTEILESVEKKSILDTINFSPELLLRIDQFSYTTGAIPTEDTEVHDSNGLPTGVQRRDEFSKDYNIAASMRFRLNMNATFDSIKFYGRLLYANSSQSNQRLCILSQDIKTGTPGSAFDVDRAYVDYHYNKSLTLSFGILPTTAGTPMQYAQNKKRNSLFPALVFNMNTYGIIATQKFASASYFRFVLAKAYTLRPQFYPYQCNRENIDNSDVIGLYGDTTLQFLGKTLISYGVNLLNNFKAHPYLGPDIDSSHAHNLGLMATYGLGIDIEKFLQTPTTVFLHTALSNPHPNGEKDDYKIVRYEGSTGITAGGYEGFTEADYASGSMLQHNGYSLFVGTKYSFKPKLHFGAEFNYGSKYWFSATQGAEDTFNKLATRGYAAEGYLSWQFHRYLNAKLSYLYIQENYTGSGWHFGEPLPKDAQQRILSTTLEARF